MSREDVSLKYEKSDDDVNFVHHKFMHVLRNKKVKDPTFEDELGEVFLYMLKEFNTMLTQHEFLRDPQRVEMAYDFFSDTVDALDT